MNNILDDVKECFSKIDFKANYFGFYKTYTINICKTAYDLAIDRALNENVSVLAVFYLILDEIGGSNAQMYKNEIKNYFKRNYKDDVEKTLKVLADYKENLKIPEVQCINDAKFIVSFENLKRVYIKYVNETIIPGDVKTKFSITKTLYFKSSFEIKQKYHSQMMSMLYYFKRAIITKQETEKLKTYKVIAKCGHVGQNKYYPGYFVVKANNAADAANKARYFPRVKHDNKYAILSVEEIDEKMARKLFIKKEKEIYFHIKTNKERKLTMPLLERLLIEEEKYSYELREKTNSGRKTSKGIKIRNYKKYSKYNLNLEKE